MDLGRLTFRLLKVVIVFPDSATNGDFFSIVSCFKNSFLQLLGAMD